MSTFTYQLKNLRNESSDEELLAVAREFATLPDPTPASVAQLALSLAQSGEVLHMSDSLAADVASTGGPGSLSTLLGPLYLVTQGAVVPKLGIPGRPAGGIDCLLQVPGYNGRLSRQEVMQVLSACRYAHFLPTSALAPLDKRIFEIRQKAGLQGVAPLVIASLLAKKIAVGLDRFAIDVRVFPGGNFGATWENALQNASLFRRAADELGLTAITVLTDCRFVQQPFLGRSESLWALSEVLKGQARGSLSVHAGRCKDMAFSCLPESATGSPTKTLLEAFTSNLQAQGASLKGFEQLITQTERAHTIEIRAQNSGFFNANPATLRTILVNAQASVKKHAEDFPDPLGIKLICDQGMWVQAGHVVATVRAGNGVWAATSSALNEALGRMSSMPMAVGIEGVG